MPVYEFPIDVRREVTVGIANALRIDKPAVPLEKGEEEHKKITRMTLRHRDASGHENDVTEWGEQDIWGKGIGIQTIVSGVELAACRDAAYQFGGDCIYLLAFHTKDYMNRSRLMFKLPGGQETQHLAVVMHGRGGGMGARGDETGIAERLMPDILKYVSEKEARVEAKAELVFNTLVNQIKQLTAVVTDYTDRELKLREITLNADDHQYEREKKRKEDEEAAQFKRDGIELLKEHAPALVPHVIGAIQRISGGPNGQANSAKFNAWYEEQRREAEQKQRQAEANGRGKTNGHTAPSQAEGSPPSPPTTEASSDEPSMLDQLRLRVALSTAQFVMLIRGRKQLEKVREALSDEQRGLFDQIIEASEAEDLETEDGIARLAGLSLIFGGAVQADPASGFKLLGTLDGLSKITLVELSNLLQMYHEQSQAAATGGG